MVLTCDVTNSFHVLIYKNKEKNCFWENKLCQLKMNGLYKSILNLAILPILFTKRLQLYLVKMKFLPAASNIFTYNQITTITTNYTEGLVQQ